MNLLIFGKYRHRIAGRCRSLILKQRAHFVSEREETVQLVIRECSDIIKVSVVSTDTTVA